jgi:pimeloyl-ACP methyl ester carboxylesterase
MPIATANGVDLYHELHGEESGIPVVVLHGAQADCRIYVPLAQALADRCRVLLFDQRGLGRSAKPDVPYATEIIARDTVELMDRVGFARAHLIGFSMGGAIAEWVSILTPERVDRLVLACTFAGGASAVTASDPVAFSAYSTEPISAEERARRFARAMFTDAYLDAHPEVPGELERVRQASPLDPVGFARRMQAIAAHDASDRLAEIHAPTLVLHGREDRLVPLANSEILTRGIPGARLVVTGGGHGFFLECRDEVLAHLRDFLLPAAGRPA